MNAEIYDSIGVGYQSVRQPDPRIDAQIRAALGDARSVVNVGAGVGSYEPEKLWTVAVEPSTVMIGQRPQGAAPVIRARAEQLPFGDGAFDAAMALFTVHHWSDPVVGLQELQRVSGRQVVLTWDPAFFAEHFWFVRDYLPKGHQEAGHGTVHLISDALVASVRVEPVPIPADCTDGFYAAYWARPEAFLDPTVRAAISAFALEDKDVVAHALARLSQDLDSGSWERRYGHLRAMNSLDVGYRLVVANR